MSQWKWIEKTPEEIIAVNNNTFEKIFITSVLDIFINNKLRFKVRLQTQLKNTNEIGYTIHFFIKCSKESIIININKNNLKAQIRIKDWSTFEKLDDYSENIRKAILIDSTPCKSCPNKEGVFNGHGEYIFIYHDKEYRLCQGMCSNFFFYVYSKEDVESLLDIIKREILYVSKKRINN